MKKKKVVFQSDYSLAKTGFGRNAKAILTYLYKTGKYDLVHYSCGASWSAEFLEKTPWKSIGTLPDDQIELDHINKDPNLGRLAAYGAHFLDRIIKQEKPDVYIAAQDIWGIDFAIEKPWFNEINSVIWTTLDSLPILPSAVEKADKVKNYWIWSSFATDALHELGHKHVKTIHGALDTTVFRKLNNDKRTALRKANKLKEDDFIIGFVFRNQLRKSVPNLLDGFKKLKDNNPEAKNAKLLLHTCFSETWDIPALAKEKGISSKDILSTYVCKNCHKYTVKAFVGENLNCSNCMSTESVVTSNPVVGVTEEELNEIYNLMDVYCHPFTSGGQEFPIQEAKLAELITLVTNYSCGEEMCQEGAQSLALDWSEYRETGTQFIKASTDPTSIASQLERVFKMPPKERVRLGKKSRQWAVKNFSIESVGKKIEKFIDSCPEVKCDFSKVGEVEEKSPFIQIPEIENNSEWVLFLYHNVLKMKHVNKHNDGYKYWLEELEKGVERKEIEKYFRTVAQKENQKDKWNYLMGVEGFSDLLDKDDEGRRLLYVMPESIGDIYLSTSLFRSIHETYPDYNLYVATKSHFIDVLDGAPHVHKVIPYLPQMENFTFLEGAGTHKGYFEIAFLPFVNTQRVITYPHNGKDKIAFKEYKYE